MAQLQRERMPLAGALVQPQCSLAGTSSVVDAFSTFSSSPCFPSPLPFRLKVRRVSRRPDLDLYPSPEGLGQKVAGTARKHTRISGQTEGPQ